MKKVIFSLMTILILVSPNIDAKADANPTSLTVLEFADAKTLFVADSEAGQIFAYELPEVAIAKQSTSYNLDGAGSKIAKILEVAPLDLMFHDIATHPVSKEVYISLSIKGAKNRKSVLIKADQRGNFTEVNLSVLSKSVKKLTKPATDKVKFWRDIPATGLVVTDMDYVDGTLYVSGLSTGEFASTLRKIKFPFSNEAGSMSSVEIYHTVHDQTETRAPIRAMTVLDLKGEQTVVAAYTCTPLVSIPTSKLKQGVHVRGKTIAELGYGNTPLDVIHFSALNQQQKPEDYILVFHKERSADLIRVADLITASNKEGLSKPEMWAKAGVATRPLPLGGVLQAADQDQQYIVTLKRNITTGDVDLVSFRKGAFFRLNDFISEYNFPDYKYPKSQNFIRNFQNVLKTDSGYADLKREK